MAVRGGAKLPAPASQAARLGFGVLTFLVWYAAMLSGACLVAMLTVRTVREVGLTVVAVLAVTLFLIWMRQLFRRAVVPDAPSLLGTEKR